MQSVLKLKKKNNPGARGLSGAKNEIARGRDSYEKTMKQRVMKKGTEKKRWG